MSEPNIYITDRTSRFFPPPRVEMRTFDGEVPQKSAFLIGDVPDDVSNMILAQRGLPSFRRLHVASTIVNVGDIVLTRDGQVFRAEETARA